MTGRKPHISAWCLIALAVLLTVGCLAVGVGTAYARYREEVDGDMGIQAKNTAKVYLWAGNDPEAEYVPGAGAWVEKEGNLELAFLVTNTDSTRKFPSGDQQFRLRLVGSPGAWVEDGENLLRLTYTVGETTETLQAQVTRILPDTPLYTQFGDGWLFTFPDETGAETRWTLEGGIRSTAAMQLVLENPQQTETSLLKLQLLGDFAP